MAAFPTARIDKQNEMVGGHSSKKELFYDDSHGPKNNVCSNNIVYLLQNLYIIHASIDEFINSQIKFN